MTDEPDVQTTHVIVRDAVTGETLTSYPVSGVTDATVPLTSLPDVVAKYIKAGYVAPDALPSQVAFGATGVADVVVTLAHGSALQVTQHKVTNTVHYVNAPTALADVVQSAVVTKTIVVDAVTGQQTAQATYQTTGATVDAKKGVVTFTRVTTPAQPVTVGAVDTPTMTGFTADQRQVAAVTITSPTDVQDVTVHYTPQQQQAHVVYVDGDQDGRVVQMWPTITGLGGSHATVKPVGVPHYHVINEIGGIDFDYDTTTDQTIVVHLGHDHRLVTATVRRPIHYVGQHGHQLVPDTVQAIVLTGGEDLVTQVITWLPSELLAEATPVVAGY